MSIDTAAIPDIEAAKDFIRDKLTASGFLALSEYSDINTLEHRGEQIGFYSLEDCTQRGSCLHHSNGNIFTQTDCKFMIRLMGTCSDNDYDSFDNSCTELYVRLLIGTDSKVCSASLGKVHRSAATKRLERELTVTLRLCINEPYTAEHELPRFHYAVIGADTVIYPNSLDISRKTRTVTINTVDGRLITIPVTQELTVIDISGRFMFDEREFYLNMVDELGSVNGIDFQADGIRYTDIIAYECSACIKEGELMGEYHIRLGGNADDDHS